MKGFTKEEYLAPGLVWMPWIPVPGNVVAIERPFMIMKVKQWLKYKKDRETYGIDAEAELTRILTEEINKEIINELRRTWIKQQK